MSENVWVFGYGSLIWNPGFEFRQCIVGHIRGYSRRFYQGSDQHRGSPEKLGRVATLIKDEHGSTWGVAFCIDDEQTALEYLKQRESSIGGYTTIQVEFYPQDRKKKSIQVLVYIALPSNRLFLGSSPINKIARDIALAKGFCGYNVEYLSKLIAFMKIELPYIVDEHLSILEKEVKQILEHENPSLLKCFRDAIESWLENMDFFEDEINNIDDQDDTNHLDETIKSLNGFQSFNRVPEHQLRCMARI